MNIFTKIIDWQMERQKLQGKSIGFIATMGHLHEGHLSLCHRSQSENEVTVVSIFVNPTQFNQQSDFTAYPRTSVADQGKLRALGVDYLLMPESGELYQDQFHYQITENHFSRELEGEFRPGHFTGMLTIVMKLLNLVQANVAYFGEKDYQQLILIKEMVQAFFIPTKITACATVRAADGLALSSRNSLLNEKSRALAPHLSRILNMDLSLTEMEQQLIHLGFKVDYIAEKWQRRLAAVWLENIRLIDNIPVGNKISVS